MSLTRVLFPLAFFSLLITIVSANYEYSPNNPVASNYHHKQKPIDYRSVLVPNPKYNYDHPMPHDNGHYFVPESAIHYPKPEHSQPLPQGNNNYEHSVPTEQSYLIQEEQQENTKPYHDGLNYNDVIVQGVILCIQGSSYTPVKGAVARITCLNPYGYKSASSSILSPETDENGYFRAPLSDSLIAHSNGEHCNVFLEHSPLENCNIPTKSGVIGAPLYPCHGTETGKSFYTMGTLFYTSKTTTYSVPKKDKPVSNGY